MQRRSSYFAYALIVFALLALAAGILLLSSSYAVASSSGSPARAPRPNASSIPVVINEVYDSNNPALEYFELYNTSVTATVDLTSYVIYDSTGVNYLSRLPTSMRFLSPLQHLAIGPSNLGTATLAGNGLNNGSDYLGLTNTANDVIDVVNWGTSPNPNWNGYSIFLPYFFFSNIPLMPAPDGPLSLSRSPDGRDTDSGTDWTQLTQSPGRANPSATPTAGPSPTATFGCEDQYEPDDDFPTAKNIDQNTEQVHTLCRSGGTVKDRDFVVFSAAAGKVYTMLTKDLTGPVDTIITLYDSNRNPLAQNDDYQPGQSLASRIDYTFSTGGIYYLQIRDARSNGGFGYQYTVVLSTTGSLPPTVTVTSTPTINPFITPSLTPTVTATPAACYDSYEQDGVPQQAKLLLIGSTQHHSFCPADDADWVTFYAAAGKEYTVRTSQLGIGVDSILYVFAPDQTTLVASNDDSSEGIASRIDFFPQTSGYYYAQVKDRGEIGGPDQTYDLSLSVTTGVAQPPLSATPVVIQPPGNNGSAPTLTATTRPTSSVTPPPTQPPLPTPTHGENAPTPTVNPAVTTGPLHLSTYTPTPSPGARQGSVLAATSTPVRSEPPKPAKPAAANPNTGNSSPQNAAAPPATPQANTQQNGPVSFRLFYDANNNDSFDTGEGVRGINVLFLNDGGQQAPTGNTTTQADGVGKLTLPLTSQRVYIPYLGINIELNNFPGKEQHSLWLPPVKLPDRVP